MSGPLSARKLLADAVDTDVTMIPEDARIGAFEPWDSIAHLRLILAVERTIGRRLDPDEAVEIEKLSDIAALLDAKR